MRTTVDLFRIYVPLSGALLLRTIPILLFGINLRQQRTLSRFLGLRQGTPSPILWLCLEHHQCGLKFLLVGCCINKVDNALVKGDGGWGLFASVLDWCLSCENSRLLQHQPLGS